MTAAPPKARASRAELEAKAARGLLPSGLLFPFHEIRLLAWDESTGTGRIEAVRRNRPDDWFYACHFLSDPVMPGCWGIDAVWQALRFFAAWRGMPACDKPLGMEGVSFFGQIRPYDAEIVYCVDVVSIERDADEVLITGKADVSVDGVPVYTVASAQVGTAYCWESDAAAPPETSAAPAEAYKARLTWEQFRARDRFSASEVIALSRGTLVSDAPDEMPLLPDSLMLELHEIHHLSRDPASGEGLALATRGNGPGEWFYSMNGGVKPAALLVDGVWQLMGVFHAWLGSAGTGRALGFERVEFYGAVVPADARLTTRVRVLKTFRAPLTGDVFVRADAEVFADGRKIMSCVNANVGCHKNIRYADYPLVSEMAFGGKLKTKE
jgi:3-hydroxyacyl-[acyl-carrier protein] dehydratase/trans-2-decenoyl-[acyl-carrier protein] isomerase